MIKILYIEDNKDTAEAVSIMLKSLGNTVDLAYTGQEGLEKIHKNKYNLVIFDIMLPDMSGVEIYHRIEDEQKNCKYAFLSILSNSLMNDSSLKNKNIIGYVSKPFTKKDLINLVQNASINTKRKI